jgi:hypothetical protein
MPPAQPQASAEIRTDLEPQGLDVGMTLYIGAKLGVKVELIPVTSANRIPCLQTRKADLVISTLGKNVEREKVIDFTVAYSPFFQAVFAARTLPVKSFADLAGKTVAVTRGAMEDMELSKLAPSATEIKRFEDNNATVSAWSWVWPVPGPAAGGRAGSPQWPRCMWSWYATRRSSSSCSSSSSACRGWASDSARSWPRCWRLTVNLGAYAGEIVRAGIDATPRGQVEAGLSLALSRAQVFNRVVLPQALSRIWPAMVSRIVIVMLGSAVCGQIAAAELSYQANLIHSRNFRVFEATIVATLLYLGLAIALRRLLGWAGPRLLFGR